MREVDDKTKQYCFEIYSTTNDKIKACKHDSEGKVVEGFLFFFICDEFIYFLNKRKLIFNFLKKNICI